jgi:hypothetical protein
VQRSRKDQLTPERTQRLDGLGFVWDAFTEKWEQGFSELTIFKNENNHCRVPKGYKTAAGFKLEGWVSKQRRSKDQLTPDRSQRLDELGFVRDPFSEQWEQGFRELTIFKNENNHCHVPQRYKTASGFALGIWVGRQRGNKDQLTLEQIQRLDDLGFVWDVLAEQWEQGLSELVIFKDERSHCRVPKLYETASGYKLGFWLVNQRVNKDRLTPERIQRLNDLGFVWAPLTEKWEKGFSELAIFKDENNHCLVPRVHKTASGFRLGRWVRSQRAIKDQLTPERIQRLDELGFFWTVKKNDDQ